MKKGVWIILGIVVLIIIIIVVSQKKTTATPTPAATPSSGLAGAVTTLFNYAKTL